MAVPVLKLNLAPPSNYWRSHHIPLGWSALAVGALVLAGSLGLTWRAYRSAALTGKLAGNLAVKTRTTADAQNRILNDLRAIDVARELPRWRLAERIYTERTLPWSRLTAELERSLVTDVRLSSVQRNRGNDQKVQLKIRGEARTRAAEAEFVAALQKNAFFEQVILEREGERQGGGVEFDYTLAVAPVPPPYKPLPLYGPPRKAGAPAPQRPALAPARAAVPIGRPPMPAAAPVPLPAPGANPARPPVDAPPPGSNQVAVPMSPPSFRPQGDPRGRRTRPLNVNGEGPQ